MVLFVPDVGITRSARSALRRHKELAMKFDAREYEGRLEVFSFDGVCRICIVQLCGAAKTAFADTVQLWIGDGVSADEATAREAESLARLIKEY